LCTVGGVLLYQSSQAIAESSGSKSSKKTPEIAPQSPKTPEKAPDKEPKTAPSKPETENQQDTDSQESDDSCEIPEIYQNYAKILSLYVNDNGDVDYAKLRRKRSDLARAVRDITIVSPLEYMKWDNNEKKAFWINAHNLFTIKLIIDNYPIKARWFMINSPSNCIKQIPGGRDKVLFDVLGLEYTILEIEKERLLEQFDDLRIIFSLTQANKSSPFLRNEPYIASKIDEQLNDQVLRYLSSPHGMKIEKNNELSISGIFSWYRKYFLESKYSKIKKFREHSDQNRAYLNFIFEHTSKKTVSLLESREFTVKTLSYDWHLNESKSK
jgi:hypothetical protein